MNIKDIQIFYEDGFYTADIVLDEWFIVTEWKTFDELLKMIDDALQWYARDKDYAVSWTMPAFTFNFSHNATHLQTH